MTNKIPKAKVIKTQDDDELASWQFPYIEDERVKVDESKTNAFGKATQWKFEPPEDQIEEEVVPLTAEDIEEIRQAAYEEGFNQGKEEGFATGYAEGKEQGNTEGKALGFEEGKTEGFEQGEEEVKLLTEQWTTLIGQLYKPLAIADEQVCLQLLTLIKTLTEAVVAQEIKTNPAILMSAIEEGVKALPGQENQIEIHLHPDDIVMVEKAFTPEVVEQQGWRLMPFPSIERGSCQVENSTSQVDYQLKNRLNEVLEPYLQDAMHQLTAMNDDSKND